MRRLVLVVLLLQLSRAGAQTLPDLGDRASSDASSGGRGSTTIPITTSDVEVLSGLADGERVVIDGPALLRDGDAVEIL